MRQTSYDGPTLHALQRLNDEFHELADAFLRYQYPSLRALRPHGLNQEGKPIKGTPDSYVGASPRECTAAVEYTTTTLDGLPGKFLKDYVKAATECPSATEIYLCTNRPEREGAADEVRKRAREDGRHLVVVWGDDIARTLDNERQDLRWRFLKIPIEALSRDSLVPALGEQLRNGLKSYLPDETVLRERIARRELEVRFRRARPTTRSGVTWIRGDAGLGKTTWSAGTALELASTVPVVWFPASTCRGASGMSGAIVQAAFGVPDPGRALELVPLLRSSDRVLLVFVDAVEEVADYDVLAAHVRQFLAQSPLARFVHLVMTCRPEGLELFESIDPHLLRREHRLLDLDPLTDTEAIQFLRRDGSTRDEASRVLRALPPEFRGNPLYLQLARALPRDGEGAGSDVAWLARFADHAIAEIVKRLRNDGIAPAPEAIRKALARLARATLGVAQGIDTSVVPVDPLLDAGSIGEATLAERAVQAGLLTRSERRLGFAHALLCEHFVADDIVRDERQSADAKADLIATLPRRRSVARLAARAAPKLLLAIARRHPTLLPELEPAMLSEAELSELVSRGRALLDSNYPSERAAGIQILGAARTRDARRHAVDWYNALDATKQFRHAWEAAELFLQLELSSAAQVVAQHRVLVRHPDVAHYELAFARRIEALPAGFKSALADHAAAQLDGSSADVGAQCGYVALLAYLRDPRLLAWLKAKAETTNLGKHEHRALIHFDTDEAMEVFAASRRQAYAVIDAMEAKGDDDGIDLSLVWHTMTLFGNDVLAFPHSALLRTARDALSSEERREVVFGTRIAEVLLDPVLLDPYARAIPRHFLSSRDLVRGLVEGSSPDEVLALYQGAESLEARRALLQAMGGPHSPKLEELVIEALREPSLVSSACIAMMSMRSPRAAAQLHALLPRLEGQTRGLAIKALGRAQHRPALDDLVAELEAMSGADDPQRSDDEHDLVVAIGMIGGGRATQALVRYFARRPSEDVLALLLESRDPEAIAVAHGLLEADASAKYLLPAALDDPWWLYADSGEISDYPPAELDDPHVLKLLVEVGRENLSMAGSSDERLWRTCRAVSRFHGDAATAFLSEVADREEAVGRDQEVARSHARGVLAQRGDDRWIREAIGRMLDGLAQRRWVSTRDSEHLREWPRVLVRELLLERISSDRDRIERWLFLLLDFADTEDLPVFREHFELLGPELADRVREQFGVETPPS